jgi:hypothetical protein
MRKCAETIETSLPELQQEFLTIRHCALDLLRWARRYAHIEESDLPDAYRARYAQLLAYTPIFRPFLESLQGELLQHDDGTPASPEAQQLVTALQHYSAAIESARAFVGSVVSPPLELLFQDTEAFDQDWQTLPAETQAQLATELNDCCQFLLYDVATFDRSVSSIHRSLSEELDAVLYVLPVDSWRIIFTKDEDPVFHQLIVTLLRVVDADDLDATIESLVEVLFEDFRDD